MASIYTGFTCERPCIYTTKQSGKIDFQSLFKTVQDLTSTGVSSFVGDQRKDGTYEVPVMHKLLSAGAQELLKAKVAFYVDTYLVPFLENCKKSGRRDDLVEIACTLTVAVFPGFLSVDASAAHACFCAWLYVLDDACVSLFEKVTALKHSTKELYGEYMQDLLDYFEIYLHAACDSLPICSEKTSCTDLVNVALLEPNTVEMPRYIRDALHGLTLLGPSLYAVVQLIVQVVGKANISRIRQEIVNHLKAKKFEALCAPSDTREYYEQHSDTGAVKPCVEIALAACTRELGLGSELLFALEDLGKSSLYSAYPGENTTSYCGRPFQAAMLYCNYSVISANETSFVKDIGRAEESLLAVKIYHQLCSRGLGLCDFDIQSQTDHGLILDKYASSDLAFHSVKELVTETRNHMTLMLKACERLVSAATETCDIALIAGARAAVMVFVKCSLGYYLFNPFSRRYCRSFPALNAVLHNDKQSFRNAVNKHRSTRSNSF